MGVKACESFCKAQTNLEHLMVRTPHNSSRWRCLLGQRHPLYPVVLLTGLAGYFADALPGGWTCWPTRWPPVVMVFTSFADKIPGLTRFGTWYQRDPYPLPVQRWLR
jgi:hypothetical protein